MFYLAQYTQNIIISTCNHYKIAATDACSRRRKWQPTPVFLPGESHGQRSLVGCSPWGRKEPDTTEAAYHGTFSHPDPHGSALPISLAKTFTHPDNT